MQAEHCRIPPFSGQQMQSLQQLRQCRSHGTLPSIRAAGLISGMHHCTCPGNPDWLRTPGHVQWALHYATSSYGSWGATYRKGMRRGGGGPAGLEVPAARSSALLARLMPLVDMPSKGLVGRLHQQAKCSQRRSCPCIQGVTNGHKWWPQGPVLRGAGSDCEASQGWACMQLGSSSCDVSWCCYTMLAS